MSGFPVFNRYIGIDYSGAKTPTSSLKGLRVYWADQETLPTEVMPPPSPRKYWTRRDVAEWLVEQLQESAWEVGAIGGQVTTRQSHLIPCKCRKID